MSNYFSYFPTTQHDLTNNGQTVELTNILRRFTIASTIKESTSVYYNYDIQAGDRPDTIAEKYYGSSAFAWIVLHYNNITDPVFGWPLFNTDFDNFIKSKYGSAASAQGTVHEYRRVLSTAIVKNDGTIIPKRYVVVDESSYLNLGDVDRESISQFDYEIELNNEKRQIKILDKRYLSQIKREVENILRDKT